MKKSAKREKKPALLNYWEEKSRLEKVFPNFVDEKTGLKKIFQIFWKNFFKPFFSSTKFGKTFSVVKDFIKKQENLLHLKEALKVFSHFFLKNLLSWEKFFQSLWMKKMASKSFSRKFGKSFFKPVFSSTKFGKTFYNLLFPSHNSGAQAFSLFWPTLSCRFTSKS